MVDETIARRYSTALFGLARDSGALEKTVAEVDAFVAALGADPAISQFYESPVIDRAVKTGLLERSLSGRVSELTFNFLALLVRKRRETLIQTIARQLHEMLDREAGRSVAHIETPTPLGPDDLSGIARRLSAVYGRELVPQATSDPRLLGGAVVQVEDRYVDASVAGKLEEIRRHLLTDIDRVSLPPPNGKATA